MDQEDIQKMPNETKIDQKWLQKGGRRGYLEPSEKVMILKKKCIKTIVFLYKTWSGSSRGLGFEHVTCTIPNACAQK